MLEEGNVDNELAEVTGTFGIGDRTYVLPTQIEGLPMTRAETIERFLRTGEHLGSFDNLKNALFYERNYLPY